MKPLRNVALIEIGVIQAGGLAACQLLIFTGQDGDGMPTGLLFVGRWGFNTKLVAGQGGHGG